MSPVCCAWLSAYARCYSCQPKSVCNLHGSVTMRIAIVLQEWFPVPPIRGGAVETIAQELAERLVEHEVHFFCVSDPRLPLEERRGHIIYHRWRKDLLARLLLCTWKLPFKKSTSRLYFWPYAAWVARRLRRINPRAARRTMPRLLRT